MCPTDIRDVDIVALAGAVSGWVVVAEELDVWALSLCDIEENGNEVGFDGTIFAVPLGGAAGVEVSKRNVLEAMDLAVPAEDSLELEFGLAIGGDRVGG